jgi:DNA modification methylase
VDIVILTSDIERVVLENVQKKEREHQATVTAMAGRVADYDRLVLSGQSAASQEYDLQEPIHSEHYRLIHGDCRQQLATMQPGSVDFTVFSPPFLDLFSYSADPRDLGNSRNEDEFGAMYRDVADGLLHVTKQGRLVAVHVAQVPAKLAHDGFIGLKDFRGLIIQIMTDTGFDYHGDVTVDKNPQAQAVRTHSKALLFKQLKKDASWLRPGLADFILVFRKPGESLIPIHPDITNEDWVTWAHPVWYGLRESNTLNKAEARTAKDEKHIAPLQLEVIERCIRLWSNAGDTVLSPFAGIGSEGYAALCQRRQFIGIELKPEYFKVAAKNLEKALNERSQMTLLLEEG